jgi:hypothetical protein
MSFELLKAEVNAGLEGRNNGIPMGFNRLNKYIGIRKSMYFLVGGLTGSGKTSFIDDAFVLNPFDWYIGQNTPKMSEITDTVPSKIKLRIIYRSMERSRTYKLAKWVSRKIFIDQGVIIPVAKLLGWNDRMSHDEHDLFLMYEDYIGAMEDVITIIDGPENAVGIAKELKAHALQNGRIEQVDEYNKRYFPNNENEITLVILDHVGLIKTTKDQPTKKEAIDKMSDELRYARDFYGYTPVAVSQFNRSISNMQRLKNGDVEPQLEDFAESSSTQNDADVVLALFDPMRYKVADSSGYDLDRLLDKNTGAKYFRSLRLIKNSYGEDDVRIGLAFMGQIGMFKEMPKRKDITDSDYQAIVDKTFFLNT